ncbi:MULTISPECIES: transporter [unclassified Streptomyces]|uniref:aspartate-alanine antiporter-like transporter n=1 Tax=unclassified Streptomyces TaxID=2593676 RepID=UPI002D21DA9E|nr:MULTISPECIES: transporter [unclassified Streptomyces]
MVIAAGSLFGTVRFGPVRLGAAGVLFAGLLLGALDPDIGPAVPAGLSVLGLALYVYTVGPEAGPAFFRELRPQPAVTTGAVVALVLTALAVGLLGSTVLGIDGPHPAGGYAGIGTTTPGLAAAQASSPDPAQPATGYAIGYPLAVVLTILFAAGVAAVRNRPFRRDPGSGRPAELITRTVEVTRPVRRADVPGAADGRLLAGADRPAGGVPRVARALDALVPGDRVVLVGGPEAGVGEVGAVSTGLCLAAGFLTGIPKLTVGSTVLSPVLSLGTAAGPLVTAMVPGRLRRTGPLVRVLPTRANLTLRQIGLLLLACVGLTSGYAFRREAFSLFGLGLLAGHVGNPAITAYAGSRASDGRVNTGYATLFALAITVKIICIRLIAGL